jgi:hypothetical protein
MCAVRRHRIDLPHRSLPGHEILPLDLPPQSLQVFPAVRLPVPQLHFESVVLFGIVACRQLNPCVKFLFADREVIDRARRLPDCRDRASGRYQSFNHRFLEPRPMRPRIPPDDDGRMNYFVEPADNGPERLPDEETGFFVELRVGFAPNIICTENEWIDHTFENKVACRP